MFDTKAFLDDNFGDVDGVLGLLAKHDCDMPNREAARKWFARSSLTVDWLAELCAAVKMETGRAVDLTDYRSFDVFG